MAEGTKISYNQMRTFILLKLIIMTSTEIAIISAALAIAIPLTIFLYKRYFVGAFLTIKIAFNNGLSSPAGTLIPFIDEDGYAIHNRSIIRHHLTWNYNVTITNNSDNIAYFPKLYYKNEQFPNITIGAIEELQPIGSKESVTIKIQFFETSDTLPTQRKGLDKPPSDFTTLKLLLEYYNTHHAKFYTLYDNANKLNKSSQFRPDF